jgi:PAS domain S-box-containing protein
VTLRERQSSWDLMETQQLLPALLSTSTVGVAICDRQLRFRSINDALASMNGVPAQAHIGKTVDHILGSAAARVAPAFQHVFSTGNPLPNFELTARLPSRSETGHWIENYYPIKAGSGKVLHVGVIVLEITKRKNVEQSLDRLTSKLHRAAKTLKTHGGIRPQSKEQAALPALPAAAISCLGAFQPPAAAACFHGPLARISLAWRVFSADTVEAPCACFMWCSL